MAENYDWLTDEVIAAESRIYPNIRADLEHLEELGAGEIDVNGHVVPANVYLTRYTAWKSRQGGAAVPGDAATVELCPHYEPRRQTVTEWAFDTDRAHALGIAHRAARDAERERREDAWRRHVAKDRAIEGEL